MSESQLHQAIITAANLYPGDCALASAYRVSLLSAGAVTARRGGKPHEHELVYDRANDFPEHPWNDYGSEAYNEQLRREHQAREAEVQRQDELQAQAFENSALGQQRRQIIGLVNEAVDARIGELLRALDGDAVSRLRERVKGAEDAAPVTEDRRDAGEEGEQ